MTDSGLHATAQAMVAPGKGILAVDESVATCSRRFEALGITSTSATRAAYREMLFRAPGLGDYISGAILYDETIRQSAQDGTPLVQVLNSAGLLPGIKVDRGVEPLAAAPGERVTEGLDGLRARLEEYASMGARFTKWRAVFTVSNVIPSQYCIAVNAHALGRYAALAQEAGLVPIVEPEVLMDGDHNIERCAEVTAEVLRTVFSELDIQRCQLDGIVLKPNMVISGSECRDKAAPSDIAARTLQVLERLPADVPGIAFLSGGQTGVEASANLNEINLRADGTWELTYSFGRALQYPAIEIWAGQPANAAAAQQALLHRARMSSLARAGEWTPEAEQTAA